LHGTDCGREKAMALGCSQSIAKYEGATLWYLEFRILLSYVLYTNSLGVSGFLCWISFPLNNSLIVLIILFNRCLGCQCQNFQEPVLADLVEISLQNDAAAIKNPAPSNRNIPCVSSNVSLLSCGMAFRNDDPELA